MRFARRTKIVCTIGPASSAPDVLRQLIAAGMDVARLNFSHGTHAQHAQVIADVRAAAVDLGQPVALLQDLQGPKIRTGSLAGGQPVQLADGAAVTITTRDIPGDAATLSTTYQNLPADVTAGDRILLADGLIELRVEASAPPDVLCRVVHGGLLGEHQGINLPGVAVSAPALTAKDRVDLAFGVEHGVDYVALSFVRRPEDMDEARTAIRALQSKSSATLAPIPLIAKLEKPEAIARLGEILARSDGVMVARGDLGVELPLEQVPLIQKQIIRQANALGLPVITATQMLESMIVNPRPTRAEVSDVANAILDGTDAVMLSGETAVGRFPVETVRVMARIAAETETHGHIPHQAAPEMLDAPHAISHAARTLAAQSGARLIVVFTRSGLSAQLISKERPHVPILALTPDDAVLRRLALWWGVAPRRTDLMATTEELIQWMDGALLADGLAQPGDDIVVLGGMPIANRARTNFVKLHRIGDG